MPGAQPQEGDGHLRPSFRVPATAGRVLWLSWEAPGEAELRAQSSGLTHPRRKACRPPAASARRRALRGGGGRGNHGVPGSIREQAGGQLGEEGEERVAEVPAGGRARAPHMDSHLPCPVLLLAHFTGEDVEAEACPRPHRGWWQNGVPTHVCPLWGGAPHPGPPWKGQPGQKVLPGSAEPLRTWLHSPLTPPGTPPGILMKRMFLWKQPQPFLNLLLRFQGPGAVLGQEGLPRAADSHTRAAQSTPGPGPGCSPLLCQPRVGLEERGSGDSLPGGGGFGSSCPLREGQAPRPSRSDLAWPPHPPGGQDLQRPLPSPAQGEERLGEVGAWEAEARGSTAGSTATPPQVRDFHASPSLSREAPGGGLRFRPLPLEGRVRQ